MNISGDGAKRFSFANTIQKTDTNFFNETQYQNDNSVFHKRKRSVQVTNAIRLGNDYDQREANMTLQLDAKDMALFTESKKNLHFHQASRISEYEGENESVSTSIKKIIGQNIAEILSMR